MRMVYFCIFISNQPRRVKIRKQYFIPPQCNTIEGFFFFFFIEQCLLLEQKTTTTTNTITFRPHGERVQKIERHFKRTVRGFGNLGGTTYGRIYCLWHIWIIGAYILYVCMVCGCAYIIHYVHNIGAHTPSII